MAGGFDKFVNSVNRGITTINVKTSSSLEKSKIKTHIDTLNADIAKLYSLTGEMMYYKWKNGRDDLSDVYDKFEVIKQKFEEIEKLNKEIVEIDEKNNDILVGENVLQAGTQAAPQPPVTPPPAPQAAPQPAQVQTPAAPPVPPQAALQPVAPVAPAQPVAVPVTPPAPPAAPTAVEPPVAPAVVPAAPVGIVCPNCGSEYKDTVKFCRKCGTRLQ